MNSGTTVNTRQRAFRGKSLGAVFTLLMAIVAFGVAPVEAAPKRVVVAEGESIQAAIDAANPGTKIVVEGDHSENLWINKNNITLEAAAGASITMPDEPVYTPCSLFGQPATLICVSPDQNLDAPPEERLNNVTIDGFELNNPLFDAIGTLFTNNVRIRNNTIMNPGCDGIFVVFARGFWIESNVVEGAQCAGIHPLFSTRGRVQRNSADNTFGSGIALDDTSHTVVRRNTASGNCFGISIIDGPDLGAGIQDGDFAGGNNRIDVNTTNGNSSLCPFGFDGEDVGATGVLSLGASNMVFTNNTANDNATTGSTLTPGGFHISDFAVPGEEVFVASNISFRWNKATGNSSADGPLDVFLNGEALRGRGNRCDYSAPDPSWCKGR